MAEKSVQELYAKSRHCIDVQHKSDKAEKPFASYYEAAGYLSNALNNLKNKSSKGEDAIISQAQILYELGCIDADTEEAGAGTKYLTSSVELLKTLPTDVIPKRSILYLAVLNQLAIIDSSRSQLEEALKKLKQAEGLYNALREKWEKDDTLDGVEHHLKYLLGASEIPSVMKYSIWLEEEGTKTKYYLAQCYQHMDDKDRAAMYCHVTLKKQLQHRAILSFFDPIDWAINAATLSQFFLFRDEFQMALHLLACADYMMKTVELPKDDQERLKWRGADIARCWIKYCVYLLDTSKERKHKIDEGKTVEDVVTPPFPKKMIDNEEITVIEKDVPYKLAENFDQARQVFLVGQRKVSEASAYYSLEDRASDYVHVAQDQSKLFSHLAEFEPQIDRQCKMHKRRIDLFEEIVKKLNPKYYSPELQQLHFELGEVYTEMMELKFSYLPENVQKPPESTMRKINIFTEKSILHFEGFLDLIKDFVEKDSASGDGIAKYEDSYVRPALIALFSVGRARYKTIAADPREQLKNLEKSKIYFDRIESYLKKYPDHEKYITAELPLLKELQALIAKTMTNVASNVMY